MPIDPVNKINCSSTSIDQTTCWNPGTSALACGAGESYKYEYDSSSNESVFKFNLEYSNSVDWSNVFVGSKWDSISPTNNCFNMKYQKDY